MPPTCANALRLKPSGLTSSRVFASSESWDTYPYQLIGLYWYYECTEVKFIFNGADWGRTLRYWLFVIGLLAVLAVNRYWLLVIR